MGLSPSNPTQNISTIIVQMKKKEQNALASNSITDDNVFEDYFFFSKQVSLTFLLCFFFEFSMLCFCCSGFQKKKENSILKFSF